MDYAYLWLTTVRDGESILNPQFILGAISVYHDNHTYYYKAPPKGDINGFKGWLSSVFAHGITRRITGRYPNYTIEGA